MDGGSPVASSPPVPDWLPQRLARGGASAWVVALLAGVACGGIALIPLALLADRHAFSALAVLVAVIAGVYLGFALVDGRSHAAAVEAAGIALFVVLAVVALSTGEAPWLAAGLLGHALWDVVHHPRGIDTATPWGYAPLCLGFDVTVGVYAIVRF